MKEDDVLLQIETDKVTIDVRYTDSGEGTVKEMLVKADDTVSVGQEVAVVAKGAASQSAPQEQKPQPSESKQESAPPPKQDKPAPAAPKQPEKPAQPASKPQPPPQQQSKPSPLKVTAMQSSASCQCMWHDRSRASPWRKRGRNKQLWQMSSPIKISRASLTYTYQ